MHPRLLTTILLIIFGFNDTTTYYRMCMIVSGKISSLRQGTVFVSFINVPTWKIKPKPILLWLTLLNRNSKSVFVITEGNVASVFENDFATLSDWQG